MEYELCPECLVTLMEGESLFWNCHHICATCGYPLLHADCVCTHGRIPALFRYRGLCRELLIAYKERETVRLADTMAYLMCVAITRLHTGKGIVGLVPIPSGGENVGKFGRETNAMVAARCAREPKIEVLPLLVRAKGAPVHEIAVHEHVFHIEDFELLLAIDDVMDANSCVELSLELLKQRFDIPVKALCMAMD